MKKFKVDNEIYYFDNNKFYDSKFVEIDGNTLQKVGHEFFYKYDYKKFDKEVIRRYICAAKESGLKSIALNACLFGLAQFQNDPTFVKGILPITTSLYRSVRQPKKAVELGKHYLLKCNCESVPLYTSLAAAYCDIGDYEVALDCAHKAYILNGSQLDDESELGLVYARIRKNL